MSKSKVRSKDMYFKQFLWYCSIACDGKNRSKRMVKKLNKIIDIQIENCMCPNGAWIGKDTIL